MYPESTSQENTRRGYPSQGTATLYHPTLFAEEETVRVDRDAPMVVPQKSLYDMGYQSQHSKERPHVTVFGFSQHNRENVLNAMRKRVNLEKKEEGKNYVNIWTENPLDLEELMAMNHQIIEGEIIGVLRRNCGPVTDKEIYVKRKGLFRVILEYFIGE